MANYTQNNNASSWDELVKENSWTDNSTYPDVYNYVEQYYADIPESTTPKITTEDLKFLQNSYGKEKYAYTKKRPYAEWVLRAMDPNMKTILIGKDEASHLLSYGSIDDKVIIYPKIQKIGSNLVNTGAVPYASDYAIKSALANKNYLEVENEADAERITKTYKQYFPGFRRLDKLSNQSDAFILENVSNRINIAKNFLKDRTINYRDKKYLLDKAQIAAILGNYLVESGLDETKQEASGAGFGLAQWTDPTRKEQLNNHRPNVSTEFERQLDFTLHELSDPNVWYDKSFAEKFFNATNASDASKYFMNGFEAPKKKYAHENRRNEASEYFYQYFQQGGELKLKPGGKITPEHARLLGRRGMPGDKEALAAAGYDSKGRPLVTFGGGSFGSGGAGATFGDSVEQVENYDYIRNTPILQSFSDAFNNARKSGLSSFTFNDKEYTTEMSDNPNYVGKKYQPLLNVREILDKNMKVMSDSTRIEPYVGQLPGVIKRKSSQ